MPSVESDRAHAPPASPTWVSGVLLGAGLAAAWGAITASLLAVGPDDARFGATVAALTFLGLTGPVTWWWLRRVHRRVTVAEALEARARRDLRELARTRAVFLTSVSHELRTPLTMILGCAQTIGAHQQRLGAERVAQLAARLEANAHRLEQVVEDLLTLMGPAREQAARLRPVDVTRLLRDAVVRHGDARHRMFVSSDVDVAQLDEAKVRRILGELLRNVVRHTPGGTRTWVSAWSDRGRLHVTVADDGPGVEPGIVDAVLDPLVQGDHVDRLPSPGLGLGLALAARYAELHGGSLVVDRPPGGGTRVDVVLPHVTVRDAATTLGKEPVTPGGQQVT